MSEAACGKRMALYDGIPTELIRMVQRIAGSNPAFTLKPKKPFRWERLQWFTRG